MQYKCYGDEIIKYSSKSKKYSFFGCWYLNSLEYRPEGIESIPNLLSYVGSKLHRFGLREILALEKFLDFRRNFDSFQQSIGQHRRHRANTQ